VVWELGEGNLSRLPDNKPIDEGRQHESAYADCIGREWTAERGRSGVLAAVSPLRERGTR
jgi:hypothetical protein